MNYQISIALADRKIPLSTELLILSMSSTAVIAAEAIASATSKNCLYYILASEEMSLKVDSFNYQSQT
ncbi:MAG: hypothetical protein MUD14_17945 [Hydrococcus sp. Prado102]|jgi:hypothetical protein|nr:hypothetical protein [Hydrococcus sp. Prado102]